MQKTQAVAAIELAKPVDIDKLMAGAEAMLEDNATVSLAKVRINESEALVISDDQPTKSKVYVAMSSDPQTLFITFNQPSLEAALQRQRKGDFVQPPATLQTVTSTDAQVSFAFIALDSARQAIQEQLTRAQANPQSAMLAGFIMPFKDLRSMAISVRIDTGMRIDIASDLGQEQAATQVAALLQTMVIPMLSGLIAEVTDQMPAAISDKMKVSAEGAVLRIGIKFSSEEWLVYQKKAAGMSPKALFEPHESERDHLPASIQRVMNTVPTPPSSEARTPRAYRIR